MAYVILRVQCSSRAVAVQYSYMREVRQAINFLWEPVMFLGSEKAWYPTYQYTVLQLCWKLHKSFLTGIFISVAVLIISYLLA